MLILLKSAKCSQSNFANIINVLFITFACYRERREENDDESLDIKTNVYKDIETYSPPNLSKYISVEVEKLLMSKVST